MSLGIWERQTAAQLASLRLQDEYRTEPIVMACLTMARNGDVDLLSALVECIKALTKAKRTNQEQLLEILQRQPLPFHCPIPQE